MPSDRKCRLHIGKGLREFNLVHPHNCFNRTTCTRRHITPENDSPNPEILWNRSRIRIQVFQLPFSGKSSLFPLRRATTQEHYKNSGCLGLSRTCSTVRTAEVDRQAVASCNRTNSTPPLSIKVVSSVFDIFVFRHEQIPLSWRMFATWGSRERTRLWHARYSVHMFTIVSQLLKFRCIFERTKYDYCKQILTMWDEMRHHVSDHRQAWKGGQFGSLCNCNMNFITSCLLLFLGCSFEACFLGVQSVSALLLPVNVWPVQKKEDNCDRWLPLWSHVYFSREGLMNSVHDQLSLRCPRNNTLLHFSICGRHGSRCGAMHMRQNSGPWSEEGMPTCTCHASFQHIRSTLSYESLNKSKLSCTAQDDRTAHGRTLQFNYSTSHYSTFQSVPFHDTPVQHFAMQIITHNVLLCCWVSTPAAECGFSPDASQHINVVLDHKDMNIFDTWFRGGWQCGSWVTIETSTATPEAVTIPSFHVDTSMERLSNLHTQPWSSVYTQYNSRPCFVEVRVLQDTARRPLQWNFFKRIGSIKKDLHHAMSAGFSLRVMSESGDPRRIFGPCQERVTIFNTVCWLVSKFERTRALQIWEMILVLLEQCLRRVSRTSARRSQFPQSSNNQKKKSLRRRA